VHEHRLGGSVYPHMRAGKAPYDVAISVWMRVSVTNPASDRRVSTPGRRFTGAALSPTESDPF
jgi:hypothetical protein